MCKGRRPFSLAVRLTFFMSLCTTVAFLVFSWVMIHSVEEHFYELDAEALLQINEGLTRVIQIPVVSRETKTEQLEAAVKNHPNASVLAVDAQGERLAVSDTGEWLREALPRAIDTSTSASAPIFTWESPRDASLRGEHTVSSAHHHGAGGHPAASPSGAYRVIATRGTYRLNGNPEPYTLLVGVSIDFHTHYIRTLTQNLLLIAAGISIVLILLMRFVIRQGHRPLRHVSDEIKNITSKNLDMRLDPQKVPVELEQLVRSFNQMIEKIEDVFTRQANFSVDIAHEIRTPVTNLMTQTEIALSQSRTKKELEDVLYSNLEEYNRMTRMISDMLFLAQADNAHMPVSSQLLDLKTEVTKVFDFFEAWADERSVGLVLIGDSVEVTGDSLMIRRAISNLLSNAVRYTPAGQSVTVRLEAHPDSVSLEVANPGTPIPAEHLPKLFDRFYRVDPSRRRQGEGSGIGLAIVKSIVQAHHGVVTVASDAESTRFLVTLPKVPPNREAGHEISEAR